MYESKPWLKYYGKVPESISYPDLTMYEMVKETAKKYPDIIAYDFMGTISTYNKFIKNIDKYASSLFYLGLRKGDRITISRRTGDR